MICQLKTFKQKKQKQKKIQRTTNKKRIKKKKQTKQEKKIKLRSFLNVLILWKHKMQKFKNDIISYKYITSNAIWYFITFLVYMKTYSIEIY